MKLERDDPNKCKKVEMYFLDEADSFLVDRDFMEIFTRLDVQLYGGTLKGGEKISGCYANLNECKEIKSAGTNWVVWGIGIGVAGVLGASIASIASH